MAEAGATPRYRLLGIDVELTGDRDELAGRFERIYGAFRVSPATPAGDTPPLRIELRSRDGDGHTAQRAADGALPEAEVRTADADQLCLAAASLVHPASPRLVVHGGALARDGAGYVVCASSGSGKTTLVLELARRGFALLSDELAPIDPATGTVEPFPRALGLRDGALAIHRWIDTSAGSRARNAKGEFKLFVDPRDCSAVTLGDAVRLRHVVFLALPSDVSERASPAHRTLELTFGELSAEAEVALATIEGVESVRRLADRVPGTTVRLTVAEEADNGPALERWSRAFAVPIVASRWGAHAAPRFDQEPSLTGVAAAEGLVELARHLLNGRPPSRLLDAHGGSRNRLLVTLARATSGARFWRLVVGDLARMGQLVEAL